MSTPIKPTVGSVPSATPGVEPLKQSVGLSAEVQTPNFEGAFANLASTPTVMGEIGANMMLQAGVAQAKNLGQYLGANPSGEILPPITKADEAFVESYSKQAESTLSLQATNLINKSQEEMAKAYQLGPDAIAQYHQKVGEGLSKIAENAPSTIKSSLENQFKYQLAQTTHQYNQQRINQDKELTRERYQADLATRSTTMFDAARNGDYGAAAELRRTVDASIKATLGTGMITPLQAQAQSESLKLSYFTALKINQGISSGNVDGFVSQLADQKPPRGVSWKDWGVIQQNTASYFGQMKNMERSQDQLYLSQGQLDIQDGTFNSGSAAYYKQVIRNPAAYNNLMAQFYVHQRKTSKAQFQAQTLAGDYSSVDAHVGVSKEVENATFDSLVSQKMQNAKRLGKDISQDEAEYQVQATNPVGVPKYIEGINKEAMSGTAQDIQRATQKYERMKRDRGDKVTGVNEKALAMMALYPSQAIDSKTPEEAAAKTRDIVFNKNEDVLKLNNLKIAQYSADHWQKNNSDSWVRNNSTLPSIPAQNWVALKSDMMKIFKGAMQLTNGDEQASLKIAQDKMRALYSVSNVNGTPQLMRFSPEHEMNLGDSTPLVQEDLVNFVNPQLAATRKAYDSGASPYYWRIKDRISFSQYQQAKKELENSPSVIKENLLAAAKGLPAGVTVAQREKDDKFKEQKRIVSEFEAGKPVEIEQVFKNKDVRTFNMGIRSTGFMGRDTKTNRIIGDYDVEITNQKTGGKESLTGYWGGQSTAPVYRLNSIYVQDRYPSLRGKPLSWVEYQAQQKEEDDRKHQQLKSSMQFEGMWGVR